MDFNGNHGFQAQTFSDVVPKFEDSVTADLTVNSNQLQQPNLVGEKVEKSEKAPSVPPPCVNYQIVPLKRNGKGYLLSDRHVFIKSNERNGTYYLKCLAWRQCSARAKIDAAGIATITAKHDDHEPPDLLSLAYRTRALQAPKQPRPRKMSHAQGCHQARKSFTTAPGNNQDFSSPNPDSSTKSNANEAGRPKTSQTSEYNIPIRQLPTWPIIPLGFKLEAITRRLRRRAEGITAHATINGTSILTPPPENPFEWLQQEVCEPKSEEPHCSHVDESSGCQRQQEQHLQQDQLLMNASAWGQESFDAQTAMVLPSDPEEFSICQSYTPPEDIAVNMEDSFVEEPDQSSVSISPIQPVCHRFVSESPAFDVNQHTFF